MTTTELRLWVVTLLAGVYLLAWRAMIRPAADAPAQPAAAAVPPPAIVVPAGWRLAGSAPQVTPEVTPVVRPAPRPRRIRTRSS